MHSTDTPSLLSVTLTCKVLLIMKEESSHASVKYSAVIIPSSLKRFSSDSVDGNTNVASEDVNLMFHLSSSPATEQLKFAMRPNGSETEAGCSLISV